tara:strand:- start:1482 stop:1700 length:219 start_codon:yes stop_codon:yes gene_type:complete
MPHKGIDPTEPAEVPELLQGITTIAQGVHKHIEAHHHRAALIKDLHPIEPTLQGAATIRDLRLVVPVDQVGI